ncbi:hypothetical protein L3X38_036004 [Prunus dulcis]|uniref:Uncharacterized protein n=1 Tax=Prunus dulcis TaxID=3755 RepID=A0AAD4YN61_PRUDU|nr:hypothetical protein L3X38_036004 [Prunus dulcis]
MSPDDAGRVQYIVKSLNQASIDSIFDLIQSWGAPRQADGKTCDYCVMQYMEDICEHSSFAFQTKYARSGKKKRFYTQTELDEVQDE